MRWRHSGKSYSLDLFSFPSRYIYPGPPAIFPGSRDQSGFVFIFQGHMINLDLFSFFQGHMIVLDLFSEVKPMYQNFESFYGQPFIWNMLHNFGGTIAMYGTIESIHTVSSNQRWSKTMEHISFRLSPNRHNWTYMFLALVRWLVNLMTFHMKFKSCEVRKKYVR